MKTHDDTLFQLYMTAEDVKALKKAVLGTDDPANELCIRCDNILCEIEQHLKDAEFKKTRKN